MKQEALSSPQSLEIKQFDAIPTTLPVSYRHRPVKSPEGLVLFLHGYADNSGSLLRRLFPNGWPEELKNAALLAPNGPFPVPVKIDNTWKKAYSWYFYDTEEDRMVISPETARTACLKMIDAFGYQKLPKLIVGFSQGGFLAPYLAPSLEGVGEIVGIGTGYRKDYYGNGDWTVTGIHGTNDEVIEIESSRKAHAEVLTLGHTGQFIEMRGTPHIATAEIGKLVIDRYRAGISTKLTSPAIRGKS